MDPDQPPPLPLHAMGEGGGACNRVGVRVPLRKPRLGTEGVLRGGAQGWCDAGADVPTRKEGPALAWRIDARGRNLHCREEGDAQGKSMCRRAGRWRRGREESEIREGEGRPVGQADLREAERATAAGSGRGEEGARMRRALAAWEAGAVTG